MFRSLLIGAFSAGALLAFAPAASAMPIDATAGQSISHDAATKIAVVCNGRGRCWRGGRVYAPRRVYVAPRRVYVAPRRVYVAPRVVGPRCGWRHGVRVCW